MSFCNEPGCDTHAEYGTVAYQGEKCQKHKKTGMWKSSNYKVCGICMQTPAQSFSTIRWKWLCKGCKCHDPTAKRITNPQLKCQHPGCTKKAPDIMYGETPVYPTACSKHYKEGMVRCYGGRGCNHLGCDVNRGLRKGKDLKHYCADHVDEGIKSIRYIKCEKCDKDSEFGPEHGKRLRCKEHREPTDIRLFGSPDCIICLEDGIYSKGTNSIVGKHYCAKHAKEYVKEGEEIIKVSATKCVLCGARAGRRVDDQRLCYTCADGRGTPLYIKSCDECDRKAKYGFRFGVALKCIEHRKHGMFKSTEHPCEDCVSEDSDKPTNAHWGQESTAIMRWCANHAKTHMEEFENIIDLKNLRCFSARPNGKPCGQIASFDRDPNSGIFLHCQFHAKNMDHCRYARCARCRESRLIDRETYGDLCVLCYGEEHDLNDPIFIRRRKEKRVYMDISSMMPRVKVHHNIQIGGSRFRPDIILIDEGRAIIIEVDEFQHSKKGTDKEYDRMMAIATSLEPYKVYFIRFNPDDYMKKDGTKIDSCFDIFNKLIDEKEWSSRMFHLFKTAIECTVDDESWDDPFIVKNLFYDEVRE